MTENKKIDCHYLLGKLNKQFLCICVCSDINANLYLYIVTTL